ncbi:MAG TPA: hypothetical protein VGR94_04030 [Candidatus Acidoferrales bacterium]|nr:hypothetical protein [Candidatus Acidoferrales bacterium]
MKRSGGVTAAAVVLIVINACICFFTFFATFGAVVARMIDPQHAAGMASFLIGAIVIALIGIWGIVTGIGILRLRRWAWFCTLVFAVLLIAAAVPGILRAPHLIRATTGTPTVGADGLITFEYVSLAFSSALPLALGVWWILLFVLRSTRAQFAASGAREAQVAADSAVVYAAGVPFAPPPAVSSSRRPASITVIAIILLAGAAAFPLLFLCPRNLRIAVLFGVLLTGNKMIAALAVQCGAELVLGIGLLRLKPWAHIGTIAFCVVFIVNGVLSAGSVGRVMQAFQAAMGGPALPQFPPTAMRIVSIFGVTFALTLNSLAIYFLVSRGPAFKGLPPSSASSASEPAASAAAPGAQNGASQ